MRQNLQHIALLSVVLLCFALDGVGQEEYKCAAIQAECETCYELHRKQLGWQCPDNNKWVDLGKKIEKFAGAKTEKGGTSWSDRINLFQTVSGMEYKIQNLHGKTFILECGDAMIFTDDGGIQSDGKYCQIPRLVNKCIELDKVDKSKCIKWGDCPSPSRCVTDPKVRMDYDFNIKSADGFPLRVRVFEMALRAHDVLKFHDAQTGEVVMVYGYPNSWSNKTKDIYGNLLYGEPPADYATFAPKCSGYNHCRFYEENPAPTNANPNMEQIFYVNSGEARVTWDKRYREYYERTKVKEGTLPNIEMRGNVVRAGWVMVIDVLSAKITDVSIEELTECREDEVVVTFVPVAGAKDGVKSVEFMLDGMPFKTVDKDYSDPSNPVALKNGDVNKMRFKTSELGGAGVHSITVGAVNDMWSRNPNVGSHESLSYKIEAKLTVKPKPIVNLAQPETDICDGEFAYINIASVDGVGSNKQDLYFEKKSTNGEWVSLYTDSGTGLFGVGTPRWDSNSSQPFTVHEYRVKVVVLDINNNPLCESDWEPYRVNVYKIPETGPQYHVPNGN